MDKVIEIRGLCKYYRDALEKQRLKALDDFSLDVMRGEVFGLLGPNGSGKTTLLKILLGLIFPTNGEAFVLGKNPRDISIKKKIGYLPESPYFYDFLSPVELLDFYGRLFAIERHERKQKIDFLLKKVGLIEYRRMRIRNFSKGMLQRLGLAASLINDPQLLFLDEPTLGLDPIVTSEMQALIRELRQQGKTIFLSSHLLSQVQESCDRIGIVHRGKLVKVGAMEELLTSKDELAVIIKNISPDAQEDLKRFIKERGADIVNMGRHKETLKDIFIDIIAKEKKG